MRRLSLMCSYGFIGFAAHVSSPVLVWANRAEGFDWLSAALLAPLAAFSWVAMALLFCGYADPFAESARHADASEVERGEV
ncbi:MAG: hypothetical protein AAGI54_08160 [Planctomycetota bacterium]